jgi:hypothetical protein
MAARAGGPEQLNHFSVIGLGDPFLIEDDGFVYRRANTHPGR